MDVVRNVASNNITRRLVNPPMQYVTVDLLSRALYNETVS
jgi:hypothetical protein